MALIMGFVWGTGSKTLEGVKIKKYGLCSLQAFNSITLVEEDRFNGQTKCHGNTAFAHGRAQL